jgi:hypothetical protein
MDMPSNLRQAADDGTGASALADDLVSAIGCDAEAAAVDLHIERPRDLPRDLPRGLDLDLDLDR